MEADAGVRGGLAKVTLWTARGIHSLNVATASIPYTDLEASYVVQYKGIIEMSLS